MKITVFILAILGFSLGLSAQPTAPVRLALVSESDQASPAADVLTAELSQHKNVQLLERDEIRRVYHEQKLSAENRDFLKLGQILGADGLLLLETTKEGTNQFLNVRLVAVKPGVVLIAEKIPSPVANPSEWASAFSGHLDGFLPKLAVLVKDAIPISVVNLRSAISSADGREREKQLKLLIAQRLSREPRIFVLERERMQLLAEEKDLKLDDSAFWSGSYLLEGIIDQNGYSSETTTVNARLTPPKGGAALSFEIKGSRTNLAEVINQLTAKVDDSLKVNPTVKEWNAADEALQYFEEAKWALRWGVFYEAEAASDSAWALGKRDVDCASVRLKSYLSALALEVVKYQPELHFFSAGFDSNGKPLGSHWDEERVQSDIKRVLSEHHFGHTYREIEHESAAAKDVEFIFADRSPDPRNIDRALHVLSLYYDFSRNSSTGKPKLDSERKYSDWDTLGIEAIVAASKVLQNFHFVPESQKPVADNLTELRSLTRSVAGWILQSPSVHDSYFVGDRIATHDELSNTIQEAPNIFSCEAQWGCFWLEQPEDCIALYRELMSSPVFCYIHRLFWLRDLQTPRLTAWNAEDRRRIPTLWNDYLRELEASTNLLLRMEYKALILADADTEKKLTPAFTNFFNTLLENSNALVEIPVEVLYLQWGAGEIVSAKVGNGIVTDVKNSLQRSFSSYYRELDAMDQQYWQTTARELSTKGKSAAFEKQKQYLKANQPFNNQEFVQLFIFGFKDYSKAQALEIQPLLAAYKANLSVQAESLPREKVGMARIGIMQVGQVERSINRILNPPAPGSQPPNQAQTQKPAPTAKPMIVSPAATNAPEIVTNVIVVKKFLELPLEGLPADEISAVTITAHHWVEEKLLLDFQYNASIYINDQNGNWQGTRTGIFPSIAIFNPATTRWNVIAGSEVAYDKQTRLYHHSTLLRGELFTSDGGQIKRYDSTTRQWQVLPVSDGNNYELFTVNDQLYAANGNMIFEIIDGGKSTRILASTRRQPPVSALDTQDLGVPALFEGPGHSLRVNTTKNIYTLADNDWREDSAAPPVQLPPVVSTEGVLFVTDGFDLPPCISHLGTGTKDVEFCLGRKTRYPAQETTKPLWEMPPKLSLARLPAAWSRAGLFLMADHSKAYGIANDQNVLVQEKIVAKGGYHAALLCFSHDLPLPQKVFLKFDAPDGCPPVTGMDPSSREVTPAPPPAWMFFTSNYLFFCLEKPTGAISVGMERVGVGYKTGIWMMPTAQIEAAVSEQKEIQRAQIKQAEAAAEQARKDLFARIDLNHNGVIDADEKEAALDDSAFIESELDAIDANHNGRLDGEELVYFDANKNKTLEPKEQAGIEIAQHLLAMRLLKKFDANGDGILDRMEFDQLVQSFAEPQNRQIAAALTPFPDDNHDGHVDLGELEKFLNQQTRKSLRPHGRPNQMFFNQLRANGNQPVDARQLFKAAVENYWQNPGDSANRPVLKHQTPPNAGSN